MEKMFKEQRQREVGKCEIGGKKETEMDGNRYEGGGGEIEKSEKKMKREK